MPNSFLKLNTFAIALLLVGCFVFSIFGLKIAQAAESNQYIIQLKTDNVQILKMIPGLEKVENLFASKQDEALANVFRFNSELSLEELQRLYQDQYIYLISDNVFTDTATRKKAKNLEPNDSGFSSNPTNVDRQWALHKANFIKAWEKTTGDRSTVVAVIDTGVDGTHIDFSKTRFVKGYNIITQRSIGKSNSDDNGHGTLIAGVIAATTNNDRGIAGAAYGVSIMPVKALDVDGTGSSSDISEAIIWAADHRADVINLSLGGIGFSHNTVLANAISYAFSKDVVIVAAAGNDVAVTGGNLDKEPVFPICNDNDQNMIIGVTATDVNDIKPGFANFGKACVDVSAPGKRILSTINHDPSTGGDSPDSYAYASGTSMAVPYVSAQAALLRSLFPEASNRQIRDRIIGSADSVDQLNLTQCAKESCKGYLGSGRINAAKSLEEQIIILSDGDVAQVVGTFDYYLINGGKRQRISPFVKNQRYARTTAKQVSFSDLQYFPEGSYASPLDGTLVKSSTNPTIYYIQSGLRRPLTGQVFASRGFKYSDVVVLTNLEIESWVEGSFLTPPDGALVRTRNNPTVYWVVNGILHAVNGRFYNERALSTFPVTIVGDNDISKFPIGDPYIL